MIGALLQEDALAHGRVDGPVPPACLALCAFAPSSREPLGLLSMRACERSRAVHIPIHRLAWNFRKSADTAKLRGQEKLKQMEEAVSRSTGRWQELRCYATVFVQP